ncbi:hypothetical protein SALBM217S_01002 [Streptomyces griseoloalbus]
MEGRSSRCSTVQTPLPDPPVLPGGLVRHRPGPVAGTQSPGEASPPGDNTGILQGRRQLRRVLGRSRLALAAPAGEGPPASNLVPQGPSDRRVPRSRRPRIGTVWPPRLQVTSRSSTWADAPRGPTTQQSGWQGDELGEGVVQASSSLVTPRVARQALTDVHRPREGEVQSCAPHIWRGRAQVAATKGRPRVRGGAVAVTGAFQGTGGQVKDSTTSTPLGPPMTRRSDHKKSITYLDSDKLLQLPLVRKASRSRQRRHRPRSAARPPHQRYEASRQSRLSDELAGQIDLTSPTTPWSSGWVEERPVDPTAHPVPTKL